MDKAEVVKYKNNLLTNLRLRGEYDAAAGIKKKVLMVEGKTDFTFIEPIKSDDTRCLSVADFMKARNAFSTSKTGKQEKYNSKEVIITILKHIAYYPEYYDFPKGAEKWPLYGLVDNDFDNGNALTRVTKLFYTDTHDLETLIISTDSELFSKLEQCTISADEVKAALYIATQLAAYRQAIIRNGVLNPSNIMNPDGTIDYMIFTEDNYINNAILLDYINKKEEKPLPAKKLKKAHKDIINDLKKLLDKDGRWKKSFDSFEITDDSDFWMDINGHDVLSAICYKNRDAMESFDNESGYKYNRDFELALIGVYNYECFKKTMLYKKLESAGLLKQFV